MHPGRRNFRAAWLSLFTTAMGLMAFLPVLALYIEEEFEIVDPQQVAMWAALIFGAGPFTAACMGPIWGALGDRFGKKRMAVRANLAIAVTTACMPLAPSPMWLLAIRIAQGMFAGYVAPVMAWEPASYRATCMVASSRACRRRWHWAHCLGRT